MRQLRKTRYQKVEAGHSKDCKVLFTYNLYKESIKISLIYAVFGVIWILLSDEILEYIIRDIRFYKQFQTYKGWFYILITTIMLYLLILRRVKLLKEENHKTILAYEAVEHLAYYDKLTGLPNRTKFEDEVNKQILSSTEINKFMIAYIDIDNFKNINDTMGHQVGDQFIVYLGECLKTEIAEPDFVARLGGDEFAILFYSISEDELLKKMEEITNHANKSWSIDERQFYISMSIGVVIYPNDGDSSTVLLKKADIAMYGAKREGKNRALFYKDNIRDINEKNIKIINDLQYGVDEEQMLLNYQPQYNLVTGKIIAVEVLIRWLHPQEGYISPGVFIPLAEESGLIYKLERWIFTMALVQKKKWEEQGFGFLDMSINLSGKTLTSDINFGELEAIIDLAKVDFNHIVVEITETANISDVDIVIKNVSRLKKRGIRIALDDFGTGYSSLNYLKKFPINIIKLDRSFVGLINEDGIDTLLIKNILALAHDLNFDVVAEGIETEDQLEFLKTYRCEIGQGYLFSKPLPEAKISALLLE